MFTIFAVLISLIGMPKSSPLSAPLPQWLVGCWLHAAEGVLSVQRWTVGGSSTLFGASWTVRRDSLVRLDVARISITDDSVELDLVPVVPSSGMPESFVAPGSDGSRGAVAAFGSNEARTRVQFHPVGYDSMRVVHERAGYAVTGATERTYRRVGCSEVLHADASEAAAMRRLHEADERAVVAGDAESLERLWTDDVIALAPGTAPRAGRAANAAAMRRSLAQSGSLITVGYRLLVDDVHVIGGHAVEWGRYEGRIRTSSNAPIVTVGGSMLRVIRRGDDGAWRVTRTMFTADPESERPRGD